MRKRKSRMYNEEVLAADRIFREGKFKDALKSYDNALKSLYSEHERARVETSIKLCKKHIGKSRDYKSYFYIDKSLRNDLGGLLASKLEQKNITIEESLLTNDLKINAREITRRICVSPFQSNLLLLMAKLIEELGLTQSIKKNFDSNEKRDILISDIIGCIIEPLYEKQFYLCFANEVNSLAISRQSLSKLQSMYHCFKDIDNIEELEVFFRANPFSKLIAQTLSTNKNTSTIDKKNTNPIVYAGSIFLNEKKFLEKCLVNHYNLVSKWCLVEGTCLGYPISKVSNDGFSKDFSSLILQCFPDPDDKLQYIAHGWTVNEGEDAKSELRNEYLKGALGEVLVVIDIDEFYPRDAFNEAVHKILSGYDGVIVPQVHFWKGMTRFIIGGYYDISHMRFFRIYKGLRYISNHNFPEGPDNVRLDKRSRFKFDRIIDYSNVDPTWDGVYCYHMGFSKDEDDMKDKTDYYVNRGEKSTRPDTTRSRAAWFTDDIPENCKVLNFNQEIYGVLSK